MDGLEPPPPFWAMGSMLIMMVVLFCMSRKKTLLLEMPFPVREILLAVDVNAIRFPSPDTEGSKLSAFASAPPSPILTAVSYTHLRAHETRHDLVCRLLLE